MSELMKRRGAAMVIELWLNDSLGAAGDAGLAAGGLLKVALEAGYSRASLVRAKRSLGVESVRVAAGWMWRLPAGRVDPGI